jgi:hypothetical protein
MDILQNTAGASCHFSNSSTGFAAAAATGDPQHPTQQYVSFHLTI